MDNSVSMIDIIAVYAIGAFALAIAIYVGVEDFIDTRKFLKEKDLFN